MNRTIIQALAIAVTAGGFFAANAYIAEPGDLTVAVPFQFEAGQKTMPSGEYVVRFDQSQAALKICEDGVYCTTVQGIAFDLAGGPHEAKMVFENSNGRMRLSRVSAPSGRGIEIHNSERAEFGARVAEPWSIVTVPAREICIHRPEGPAISAAWH